MQLSFLKTILVVALGMNNAAAQSFTATKRFKCCTQEDCTDCIGGGIADSCYDADCYNVPGEVGRKSVSFTYLQVHHTPLETQCLGRL